MDKTLKQKSKKYTNKFFPTSNYFITFKKRTVCPKSPILFQAGLLIGLVNIVFQLTCVYFLPPQIPLLYGMPEGESQLIGSSLFFLSGVLGLSILLINYFLCKLTDNIFFQYSLMLSALVINIFILVTSLKIFMLVGYLL